MTNQDPWTDPVVDEIHRIREELIEEAGGDVEHLGAWLMKTQERHGESLVSLLVQEQAGTK